MQDQVAIFDAVLADVRGARNSVCFETFIFESDALGARVLDALLGAVARGVRVRLLLDGVGSTEFLERDRRRAIEGGIELRIYHPWRSFFERLGHQLVRFRFPAFIREISQMNRRNHRKTCVIDGQVAWVGSANVSLRHADWRETQVRVEGDGVRRIERSFDWMWARAQAGVAEIRVDTSRAPASGDSVIFSQGSQTVRRRNRIRRDLILRAERIVRVVSPYFIPPLPLLVALIHARRRTNVPVEILVPARSDWPIVQWFSRAAYRVLLRAGVRIFVYDRGMIHSKVLIVDDRAIVGTSNFNFRSVLHDLEIDLILERPESLRDLNAQWDRDVREAHRLTRAAAARDSWWESLVVRFFARARRLL